MHLHMRQIERDADAVAQLAEALRARMETGYYVRCMRRSQATIGREGTWLAVYAHSTLHSEKLESKASRQSAGIDLE